MRETSCPAARQSQAEQLPQALVNGEAITALVDQGEGQERLPSLDQEVTDRAIRVESIRILGIPFFGSSSQ
jgi:hypothetical protein